MGGQVTLKTMIRKAEEGDADYLKMRFASMLGGESASGGAAAPAAEPTKEMPEPTPTPEPAATPTAEAAPAGDAGESAAVGEGDAAAGEEAFVKQGCNACHTEEDTPVAPTLHGIYGKEITLADGSTVVVDDEYLHKAIVDPQAELVEGYGPLMPPTYSNFDDQLLADLIAYIRSLTP